MLHEEHLPGGVWSGASRRRDGGGQDPSTVLQRRPAHERRHVHLDVEDLGDGGEKCTCVHAVEASTASFLGERLANAVRSAVSIVQPCQLLRDPPPPTASRPDGKEEETPLSDSSSDARVRACASCAHACACAVSATNHKVGAPCQCVAPYKVWSNLSAQ